MFNPGPLPEELPSVIDCETYVHMSVERLEATPWDFADFVERSAWKWYGGDAEGGDAEDKEDAGDKEDITEVDRRRGREELSG